LVFKQESDPGSRSKVAVLNPAHPASWSAVYSRNLRHRQRLCTHGVSDLKSCAFPFSSCEFGIPAVFAARVPAIVLLDLSRCAWRAEPFFWRQSTGPAHPPGQRVRLLRDPWISAAARMTAVTVSRLRDAGLHVQTHDEPLESSSALVGKGPHGGAAGNRSEVGGFHLERLGRSSPARRLYAIPVEERSPGSCRQGPRYQAHKNDNERRGCGKSQPP
jgi:hypothetical protein